MRGVYVPALQAYYIPSVVATPDVNYSELREEVKEETILPKELEDAKIQGTVLVQYIVNEEGDIVEATILDGVLRQVKPDGTLMSFIRLDENAQAEIREEIVKEDLMEFKGEDRERVIGALTDESLRVIRENAGEWEPAMQNDEPVRMVMVMPIRFTIDD